MTIHPDFFRTKCVRCGRDVVFSKMNLHQRTKACAHNAGRRKANRLGYKYTYYQDTLEKVGGIGIIEVPPLNKRNDTADFYAEEYAVVMMSASFPKWAAWLKKDSLIRARDNKSFRKQCMAAHRMGGDNALSAFVTAKMLRPVAEQQSVSMCDEKVPKLQTRQHDVEARKAERASLRKAGWVKCGGKRRLKW